MVLLYYKMVLLVESTQMKATEQCFPVVLFTTLYKVVLTCECLDKILMCGHSKIIKFKIFPDIGGTGTFKKAALLVTRTYPGFLQE